MDARKELTAAVVLLIFGVAVLPALIYLVGVIIIGPYEGDGGIGGLYGSLLRALGEPQAAAWLLILSPYAVVQLLRAALLLRPRKTM